MFRKVTLAFISAASLGAAALAPSAASAHGWHHGGWHGGFGHHSFYAGPTLYVGGLTNDCLQRRVVETRRGPRVRTVNVCAF